MWPSLSEAVEQKRDFCSPGWLAARAATPLESITNHEIVLCLIAAVYASLRCSPCPCTTCAHLKNSVCHFSLARRHAVASPLLFNKMGEQVERSSVCLFFFQV